MKRIAVIWIAAMLMLAGCASQRASVSAKQLADALLQNVTFRDELALIDDNMAKTLYHIENCTNAYVYIGSGATAEEVAVFEFESCESAVSALKNAKQRIAAQKESFASYVPEEVQRLENAIVKQYDRYLAVCVSDGEQAAQIISDYMKS